jgi:hypothetical protein
MFREALDVLITGLSSGELSYEGEYYSFKRVRLHIEPFQRPYPRTQHRLSGPVDSRGPPRHPGGRRGTCGARGVFLVAPALPSFRAVSGRGL